MKVLREYVILFVICLPILAMGCHNSESPSAPDHDERWLSDGSLLKAAPSLTWTKQLTAPTGLFSIWGFSSTDVFAGGGSSSPLILHYDGTSWTTQVSGGFSLREVSDIWGPSSTDVFAVGGQPGQILHYNGSSWTLQFNGASLDQITGVWGSSSTDVFAVALNSGTGRGKVYHYNGTSWGLQLELTVVGEQFFDVWGFSSTDVFAVGDPSLIYHYNGTSWSQQSAPVASEQLRAVWGSSSSDVFAVGTSGTIVHYNGSSWSSQSSPTSLQLLGIRGFASDDVFSVGDPGQSGQIHHYDGTSWSNLAIPVSSEPLTGLWGPVRDELFVIGQFGGIFQGISSTVSVDIDIKPTSCPNPLNTKSKGVLPVAILGSEGLDVNDIDVSTLELEGVAPIRSKVEDVAAPVANRQDDCDCTTDGPDSFDDLTLKFDKQAIVAALGTVYDGDTVLLTVTGNLKDGIEIEGMDCVVIKKKTK